MVTLTTDRVVGIISSKVNPHQIMVSRIDQEVVATGDRIVTVSLIQVDTGNLQIEVGTNNSLVGAGDMIDREEEAISSNQVVGDINKVVGVMANKVSSLIKLERTLCVFRTPFTPSPTVGQ